MNWTRLATAAVLLAGAFVLPGCASLGSIDTQVSSYSSWPTARPATSYAFERLPSQQAQPQAQQMLEDAARPAIEAAGFTPAREGAAPDVTVQIGARVTATERSPFDDPFWYGPGLFHRPFGAYGLGRPYGGPGWGWRHGPWGSGYGGTYYEREVALLIRDKRSGDALYESRVSSEGLSSALGVVLPAMFTAALRDFPAGSSTHPHRVIVEAAR